MSAVPDSAPPLPKHWCWAPGWVLACVVLWPLPMAAEWVWMSGALAGLLMLVGGRFRGASSLLAGPAWALTTVLFATYWLPEVAAAVDASDAARAWLDVAFDLRYLPAVWVVAIAVANERARRVVFAGLAWIAAAWTLDAWLAWITGTSVLWLPVHHLQSAWGMPPQCVLNDAARDAGISSVFGGCASTLGVVLACLSPFLLEGARRWLGAMAGWLAALAVGGVVALAGEPAAWLMLALVLVWSTWRAIGRGRSSWMVLGVSVVLAALVGFGATQRDAAVASAHTQAWSAALCMAQAHPVNGVGARGFGEALPNCTDAAQPTTLLQAPHAQQLVLEVASGTGGIGLLLWLAGAALAWRAWRYADAQARQRAWPAMCALAAAVFPLNAHPAAYSTFWGGVLLLLAALYAGSLWGRADQS